MNHTSLTQRVLIRAHVVPKPKVRRVRLAYYPYTLGWVMGPCRTRDAVWVKLDGRVKEAILYTHELENV